MISGEISDYSDLTAGQYEGEVWKREKNYKWQPYWCVLYGRQLTFYDDSEKSRVVGRIEIQPGSRCDKGQPKNKVPSLSDLYHRDHMKLKKYSLKLKTKKGTHLFTYKNIKEQTRWQIAMNNASQVNASGVRLSWIPTPFSMVISADDIDNKRASLLRTPQSTQDFNSNNASNSEDIQISMLNRSGPKTKPKSKRDDTHTLIAESDSEIADGHVYTNPNLHNIHTIDTKELVTTL